MGEYESNEAALAYQRWSSSSLTKSMADQTTLVYFGDLKKAKVVDFGCGNGTFLKQCLTKGASTGLGFDANEPMIAVGMAGNTNGEQLRLIVQDCFKPIDQTYGQYDFALAHFVMQACGEKAALETFFKNVIGLLKPGGKFFIGQTPYVANTVKDQDAIADLCGYLQPLKSDALNDTPGVPPFKEVVAFVPDSGESGRPFTRHQMFKFSGFYWSKEKLIDELKKVGFVNIKLLPPTLSDDVPLIEKKRIESLEEPFGFIGAEKPKMSY